MGHVKILWLLSTDIVDLHVVGTKDRAWTGQGFCDMLTTEKITQFSTSTHKVRKGKIPEKSD